MFTRVETLRTEHRLLKACLSRQSWHAEDVDVLLGDPGGALLRVGKALASRFEDDLNAIYADIVCHAISRITGLSSAWLGERYERVRHATSWIFDPSCVVLLSRGSLAEDIFITSVIARALRHRFSGTTIYLVGDRQTADLLDLKLIPAPRYESGSLAERISAAQSLPFPERSLVVDPDSWITLLGTLPIVPEERHCLFDSRNYALKGSLLAVARRWCIDVFKVAAAPLIFPQMTPCFMKRPSVAISLDRTGGPGRAIDNMLEGCLLDALLQRAATVVVDGAGDHRACRRRQHSREYSPSLRFHNGTFSTWASLIDQCDLHVGYQAAGQYAASALGVPTVSLLAGEVCGRFRARWRPCGRAPLRLIPCDSLSPAAILSQTMAAVEELLSFAGLGTGYLN